jgi:hypothetical protein
MVNLFNTFYKRPEYRAACDALQGLGYDRTNIRANFEIPISPNEQRWSIDGVAFSDRIAQTQHANVTIFDLATSQLKEEEAVDRLRRTTAPFHLIFNEGRRHFVLWATGSSNVKLLGEPLAPEGLANGLREFAPDLKPEIVRRVKQGLQSFQHPLLADLNPLQLTLWAEEVNGKLLTAHFGHALRALHRAGFTDLQEQGKLAAQLLAARILIDTGAMQDCDDVGKIPEAADAKHFKDYFDSGLLNRHKRRAQEAYDILRAISLATFQPEMLRVLYKSLFGKKETKVRGRFDTPLWLTRRIWQNIPIEFLRPENRVTLDMTCGWGSFLISAEERLAGLPDMNGRRLSTYIFGNDDDLITAELARVALLTSTGKDSWDIFREDARRLQLPRGKVPNIIVGNPPFSGDRKTQRTADTGGKRHELANEFLSHAVDLLAPGGFLAMVMPGSFVSSEAGPETRKQLLNTCDIFEIWDLPTGIFDDATVQPMVVFARKISGKTNPSPFAVRIRNLQKQQSQITHFKEFGEFTRSTIVCSQKAWTSGYRDSGKTKTTHVFKYRSILSDHEWEQIDVNSITLKSVTRIVNGCIRGNPRRNGLKLPNPTKEGWLTKPLKTLPAEFQINYADSSKIDYPNDLEWPRYENRDAFKKEKILLVSDPNPSWGKRVKVAIERKGYFASNSFYVVAPLMSHKELFPWVIAAVLRWKVSNAWFIERLRYPWLNKTSLDNVPFPQSLVQDSKACLFLTAALQKVEAAAFKGQTDLRAEKQIDDTLKAAFGINELIWQRLLEVYGWSAATGGRASTEESGVSNRADWIVQGAVLAVHPERDQITIWLNSFNKAQTVPIVPAMPGWLLRPDVKFISKVPTAETRNGVLTGKFWGHFEPEQFTYLDRTEAARMVNAMIKRNREAKK